jgi:hypothetical protein
MVGLRAYAQVLQRNYSACAYTRPFCYNFDDSLPSKVVICDNFGNFGGFCVGHVELIAGNVVSLGSAALCGNELLASSCLENSGFVRLSSTFFGIQHHLWGGYALALACIC